MTQVTNLSNQNSNREGVWDFVSATRLNNDCMASLDYRYNQELKPPPNIYQLYGYMGEAGIEAILRNHTQAGFDPHIVEAECLKRMNDVLAETGLDRPPSEEIKRVIDAVKLFQPSPSYQLRATQEWVVYDRPDLVPIKMKGPLDFRGEEDGMVVIDDAKVTGRPVKTPKKSWVLQGGIYALAVKQMLKLNYLPKVRIICLYRGKTPSCQIMEVDLTVEALSNIFVAAHNILNCLETGYWPPNRSSELCNDRNCAYWYRCHQDHLIPWGLLNAY